MWAHHCGTCVLPARGPDGGRHAGAVRPPGPAPRGLCPRAAGSLLGAAPGRAVTHSAGPPLPAERALRCRARRAWPCTWRPAAPRRVNAVTPGRGEPSPGHLCTPGRCLCFPRGPPHLASAPRAPPSRWVEEVGARPPAQRWGSQRGSSRSPGGWRPSSNQRTLLTRAEGWRLTKPLRPSHEFQVPRVTSHMEVKRSRLRDCRPLLHSLEEGLPPDPAPSPTALNATCMGRGTARAQDAM